VVAAAVGTAALADVRGGAILLPLSVIRRRVATNARLSIGSDFKILIILRIFAVNGAEVRRNGVGEEVERRRNDRLLLLGRIFVVIAIVAVALMVATAAAFASAVIAALVALVSARVVALIAAVCPLVAALRLAASTAAATSTAALAVVAIVAPPRPLVTLSLLWLRLTATTTTAKALLLSALALLLALTRTLTLALARRIVRAGRLRLRVGAPREVTTASTTWTVV